MEDKRSTYIVVDFECTCDDFNSTPVFSTNEMEIIEIGAVALDQEGSFLGEFNLLVRPIIHPNLTDFCKELLPHIQQVKLLQAQTFDQTLPIFAQWMSQFKSSIFCSWGAYDKVQLQMDCDRHKVNFPFSDEHINLKKEFATYRKLQGHKGKAKKQVGLKKAIELAGIDWHGQHHSALDDAHNAANIFRLIMKNMLYAGSQIRS